MNPYFEFMTSELNEHDNFTRFLELHREWVSQNSWTEHDQLAALYVLSKHCVVWRQSAKRSRKAMKAGRRK